MGVNRHACNNQVMKKRVSIIAVNDCSGIALMGAVDTFKAANTIWKMLSESEDDLFSVQIVSQDGQAITCSNSYTVSVDGDLNLVKTGDGIVCIPFAASSSDRFLDALEREKPLVDWLKHSGNKFEFIAAISLSIFLLAEAKLLDGKSASTAWWSDNLFKQRYPLINVDTKKLCVKDGNILSAGSIRGYQDVCMKIVEIYAGKSFAKSMSRFLMDDYVRRSEAPQLFASQIQSNNPIVNQADAWIQKNLVNDIRIDDIAEHVSVSSRTLSRHFQTTFGMSPHQYLQKSRVDKCKLLLDITDLDFSQIAYRCGYNDPGTLRRLFKKHHDISPMKYRKDSQNIQLK